MQDSHITDLMNISPLVVITLTALLVLVVETVKRGSVGAASVLSQAGIILAAVLTVANFGRSEPAFGGMIYHGAYGSFFSLLILSAGFLTILSARSYIVLQGVARIEYYVLVLFAMLGMMLMASARDLVVLFLGIELMSICFYVLAGFSRTRRESTESALKYFLLGAFTTGFLLYGIALVYGVTGTTHLPAIALVMPQLTGNPVFLIGAAMLIIALSFKVAAVPFHMWAPDVYEGAPTTITAFMATGGKAAAFGAIVAVFGESFAFEKSSINQVLSVIAAGSMIVGNVTAVAQSNVKRMLAYSSIAHAGYMLAGVAAGNPEGKTGVLFYLAAYLVMNVGAFGIVAMVEGRDPHRLTFDAYAGLSKKRPYLAAVMALFMFSLSGFPPLAGFFGKYYVFLAAVKADMTWLAIVGVLTSLISAYYYLRLVVVMYFREGETDFETAPSTAAVVAVTIAAFFVLQLGLYPSFVVDIAQSMF
jgi:NADH-quinone oxidoreductase subunit N